MSKTLKQRTTELDEREKKLKLKLETSGDDLKTKAKSVGKIALISGLVALIGYGMYNAFFSEDEEKPKKKRKKQKVSNQFWSRLSTYATPYIVSFLEELLELKSIQREAKEEEKKD